MNNQDKLSSITQFKLNMEQPAVEFSEYIRNIHQNGTLKEILPEVDTLFKVPENPKFHPEGNSGDHTLLTLKELEENSGALERYAMLLHDIGKVVSYNQKMAAGMDINDKKMTQYFKHPKEGLPVVQKISMHLNVPDNYKEFALLVCEHHMKAHSFNNMKESSLYDLNKEIPDKYFDPFINCCRADTLGRDVSSPEKDEIRKNFTQDVQRLKDVRTFMKEHPEVTKDTFSKEYEKAKTQSPAINMAILTKGHDGK